LVERGGGRRCHDQSTPDREETLLLRESSRGVSLKRKALGVTERKNKAGDGERKRKSV